MAKKKAVEGEEKRSRTMSPAVAASRKLSAAISKRDKARASRDSAQAQHNVYLSRFEVRHIARLEAYEAKQAKLSARILDAEKELTEAKAKLAELAE